MSRQSTPPQTNLPYTNGHYETPLEVSGVSLHRQPTIQQPTTFPPELPLRGVGPLLYALQRFQLGGLPLSRYLAAIWLIVAAIGAVDLLPGRWFTGTAALLLLIAQIVLAVRYRRQQHVTFTSAQLPSLTVLPLDTTEKVSIYATGLLGVEGRHQQYSTLPGFYRTFATGEHALLCRVQERKWLGLGSWPAEEIGMWYAFIKPSEIRHLAWGNLHFGTTVLPAVAITYQLELPPGPRRKRALFRQELLYIATRDQHDAQRVYVDLLNNLPADQLANSSNAQ